MKLSEYAHKNNITYRGAWLRYKRGVIAGAHLDETNHIVIPDPTVANLPNAAIYARVSTAKQKDSLEQQTARLITYANAQGLQVVRVVKEVASGVNDDRPKLTKLLQDDSWGTLVVEHKDRLSRVGFNWFEVLLHEQGKRISVANRAQEHQEDLMQDFVSIIYSFAARLYGLRAASAKAAKVKRALE
jgi:putative resolvase